jgi:hypothetical protein
LIANSNIYGSDIYSARIHGWNGTEEAALTIYDSSKGISFKKDYGKETEAETFLINDTAFTIGGKDFIKINPSDSAATFLGQELRTNKDSNYLSLKYDGTIPVL